MLSRSDMTNRKRRLQGMCVFACLWMTLFLIFGFHKAIGSEDEPTVKTENAAGSEFAPETELVEEVSEETDSTIDFVLVLDNSGTMAKSDPKGLTVAAAKMFIDMLPKKHARVAVVEFGSDYGADAFSADKYTRYVSVPFPLSDITSTEQKEACKQVIDETRQDGDYTPVGYAFQAACDVLEQGGATPGNAGILLISDFRVTGQRKEDHLEDGYNFQSLKDAEQNANENEWPVYTLEMNFDGKNDHPTHYTERIAERIRSQIPEKAGTGEYIPLKNAANAQAKFAEIFELYFDPNSMDEAQVQTQTTDSNGDATFQFTVGDMVAELNVTLTCDDSTQIQSVEIGRGDNLTEYDLNTYQEPVEGKDRIVTKEDRYITIKLMVPPPGEDWKAVVHGDAETEIGMYALSIHDMGFQLRAETVQSVDEVGEDTEERHKTAVTDQDKDEQDHKAEESGNKAEETEQSKEYSDQNKDVSGNTTEETEQGNDRSDQNVDGVNENVAEISVTAGIPVNFSAAYIYDGKPYASDRVYAAYPAVLQIEETGEQIPMTVKDGEYCTDVTFDKEGTYTMKAVASGDSFRTGSIETGEFQVTVVEAETEMETVTEADLEIETETEFKAETETEFGAETEPVTERRKAQPVDVAPRITPKPPKPIDPWWTDPLTLGMIGAVVVIVLILIFIIRRRNRRL